MRRASYILTNSTMPERRSEARLLDFELVMISWEDGPASLNRVGHVNDVSLTGVGIRLDHPIPVGTTVTVSYSSLFDTPLEGVVKHRSEHPDGYYLGIEFVGDKQRYAIHFHPELFHPARAE